MKGADFPFNALSPVGKSRKEGTMRVTTFGTRGSIPIANPESVKYGGNTTCLRVESACLPEGHWLILDAGSGFVPASQQALKGGVKQVNLFFTHHHHDHNQGLLLSPLAFIKSIPVHVYGPVEDGWGPKEAIEAIMRKPLFPVDFKVVASHFYFHKLQHPTTIVILVHPHGGFRTLGLDVFERLMKKGEPIPFGQKKSFPVGECLVIWMHRTDHPETAISYRFEERPTGKVFCLLTDHENQDGVPLSLRSHLLNADLMIEDAQYDPETYAKRTTGFGHATPVYAVKLANAVGVKRLGLSHHDPGSTDAKVEQILEIARDSAREALAAAPADKSGLIDPGNIFACADYQVHEV